MTDHPITPPPELVRGWLNDFYFPSPGMAPGEATLHIAAQAARWGADQELEACCEVLARELICDGKHVATDLRTSRRPKPPSLAEEALALVEQHKDGCWRPSSKDWVTIRRAVERLQELENNG